MPRLCHWEVASGTDAADLQKYKDYESEIAEEISGVLCRMLPQLPTENAVDRSWNTKPAAAAHLTDLTHRREPPRIAPQMFA